MTRAYTDLPEGIRWLDEQQTPAKPLQRYVDSHGIDADEVARIIQDVVPPEGSRSQLVDPQTAPARWLPWMAQLVGVKLMGTTESAQRAQVVNAAGGWRSGTMTGLIDAARAYFGSSEPSIFSVRQDPENPWLITIMTKAPETPDPQALLTGVERARAKPAGVKLFWESYAAWWGVLEDKTPTWNHLEALGNWTAIENIS